MNRLIRLYPRAWRQRYGDEFTALVDDLRAERRGRTSLALDIARGAVDAHLHRRYPLRRFLSDAALRRGAYDGLLVAGALAIVVVLTNVVFPQGPTESDGDPEYLVQILAAYTVLAILFVVIGARGAGRSGTPAGGFRAGAVAGFLIVVLGIGTFFVVDNVFFSIISQQHDKLVTFHASGWTSYRAWVNVQLLRGLPFVIPAGTLVAGMLGLVGGTLRLTRRTA